MLSTLIESGISRKELRVEKDIQRREWRAQQKRGIERERGLWCSANIVQLWCQWRALKLKERERDHRVPGEENPQRLRAETSLHSCHDRGRNKREWQGKERESDWIAERERVGVIWMSCDGNDPKHFSTLYCPFTRTYIHIHMHWSNGVCSIPHLSFCSPYSS